jgi:type VI secretion system protein ImpK
MQERLANLVHPVFNYGLGLKERLDRGEAPDFDTEHARLKGLLLTEVEARRNTDYGGAPARDEAAFGEEAPEAADRFLGVRYALVCWLDEFFILNTPWEKKWNERKLEVELYGTNDRAWKFWRQADLALALPNDDAVEAFFLCVLLGFRGQYRDEGDQLQSWVATTKTRVAKIRAQDWPYPLEYEPPTYVPPHFGREQLRNMILTGCIVLLLLVPVVAFFLVKRLGQ